jgi:hypothetical protein
MQFKENPAGRVKFGHRGANPEDERMSELSRDEVSAVVGKVDDIVAAEIIATGITKDELAAAVARVKKDVKAHDHGPELEPGRISRVVALLERLIMDGRLSGSPLGESGSTLR